MLERFLCRFVRPWNIFKCIIGVQTDPQWLTRFMCKLVKHHQTGAIPIGEPGDVRYVCRRCKEVTLIRNNKVFVFYSDNDPAVEFMEKMLSLSENESSPEKQNGRSDNNTHCL